MAEKPQVETDLSDYGRGAGKLVDTQDLIKQKFEPMAYYYDKFRREENAFLSNDMWLEAAKRGETANLVSLLSQRDALKKQEAQTDTPTSTEVAKDKKEDVFDKYKFYESQGLADYDDYMLALSVPFYDDTDKSRQERVDEATGYKYGTFTDKEWAEFILKNKFEKQQSIVDRRIQENRPYIQKVGAAVYAGALHIFGGAFEAIEWLRDAGEAIGYFFGHLSEVGTSEFSEQLLRPFAEDSDIGKTGQLLQEGAYVLEYNYLNHIVNPIDAYEQGYRGGANPEFALWEGAGAGTTGWGEVVTSSLTSIGEMLPSMFVGMGVGPMLQGSGLSVKLATRLTKLTSSGIFYTGITSGSISDTVKAALANGLELKDINAGEVISNAIIKSALQWSIEFMLGKMIGFTRVDKLIGIDAGEAATNAIKHIGKTKAAGLGIWAGKLLKEAFQEGMEEVLQDSSDAFINYIYGHSGSTVADIYREQASQLSFESLLKSFAAGALTSIAISTVQTAVNLPSKDLREYIDENGNLKKLGLFQTLNYVEAIDTMNGWYETLNDPKADVEARKKASLAISVTVDTLAGLFKSIGMQESIQANQTLVGFYLDQKEKAEIKKLSNNKYAAKLYNDFMSSYNKMQMVDVPKARLEEKLNKVKKSLEKMSPELKEKNVGKIDNIVTEELITNLDEDGDKLMHKLQKDLHITAIVSAEMNGSLFDKEQRIFYCEDDWLQNKDVSMIVRQIGYDMVRAELKPEFDQNAQKMLIKVYKNITGAQGEVKFSTVLDALLFDNKMYSTTLMYCAASSAEYKQKVVKILGVIDQKIKKTALKEVDKNNLSDKAYAKLMSKVYDNMKVGFLNYFTTYERLADLDKISEEVIPTEIKKELKANKNIIFSEKMDQFMESAKSEKGFSEAEKTQLSSLVDKYHYILPGYILNNLKEIINSNDATKRIDLCMTIEAASYNQNRWDYLSKNKVVMVPLSKVDEINPTGIKNKAFYETEKFLGVPLNNIIHNNIDFNNPTDIAKLTQEAQEYFANYDMSDTQDRYRAIDNLLWSNSNHILTFSHDYTIWQILKADDFIKPQYTNGTGPTKLFNLIKKRSNEGNPLSLFDIAKDSLNLEPAFGGTLIIYNTQKVNSAPAYYSPTDGNIHINPKSQMDVGIPVIDTIMHEATHRTQDLNKRLNIVGDNQTETGANYEPGTKVFVTGDDADFLKKNLNAQQVKNINEYMYKYFPNCYNYLVEKQLVNTVFDIIYLENRGEIQARMNMDTLFRDFGFVYVEKKNKETGIKELYLQGPVKDNGKYPQWKISQSVKKHSAGRFIGQAAENLKANNNTFTETQYNEDDKAHLERIKNLNTMYQDIVHNQYVDLIYRGKEELEKLQNNRNYKGLNNPLVVDNKAYTLKQLNDLSELNSQLSSPYDSLVIFDGDRVNVVDWRDSLAANRIPKMSDNKVRTYLTDEQEKIYNRIKADDTLVMSKLMLEDFGYDDALVGLEAIEDKLNDAGEPTKGYSKFVLLDEDTDTIYVGDLDYQDGKIYKVDASDSDELNRFYNYLDSKKPLETPEPSAPKAPTEEIAKTRKGEKRTDTEGNVKYKYKNRVGVTNEVADKSNLKYFKQVGKHIYMNEGVRDFIIGTTDYYDKLSDSKKKNDPLWKKIKNGTLNFDDINHYAKTADKMPEELYKAIAKLFYKNDALAAMTFEQMKALRDDISTYATLALMTEELEKKVGREDSYVNKKMTYDELVKYKDKMLNEINSDESLARLYQRKEKLVNSTDVGNKRVEAFADPLQLNSSMFLNYDGTLASLRLINFIGTHMANMQVEADLIENADDGHIESTGSSVWNWTDRKEVANIDYTQETDEVIEAVDRVDKENFLENFYKNAIMEKLKTLTPEQRKQMTQERVAKILSQRLNELYEMSDEELNKRYLIALKKTMAGKIEVDGQIPNEEKEAPQPTRRNIKYNFDQALNTLRKILSKKGIYDKIPAELKKIIKWNTNKGAIIDYDSATITTDDMKRLTQVVRDTRNSLKTEAAENDRIERAKAELKEQLKKAEERYKRMEAKWTKAEQEKEALRDKLKKTQEKYRYRAKDFSATSDIKANKTVKDLLNTNWGDKTRMSEVQGFGTNEERTVASLKGFYKSNAGILLSADLNDIVDAVNWFMNAKPSLDSIEDYKNFQALKIFFLGYVLGETKDGGLYMNMNDNLKQQIDKELSKEATVGGLTLSVIQSANRLVNPYEAMNANAITIDNVELPSELQDDIFNSLSMKHFANLEDVKKYIIQDVSKEQFNAWPESTKRMFTPKYKADGTIESIKANDKFTEFEKTAAKEQTDNFIRMANVMYIKNTQQNIIQYVENKKTIGKSIVQRVVAVRSMSMLSSPVTWLRNLVSNMIIKPLNKLSSKIGNSIFKGHTMVGQLKLNKKITTEIQNYISTNFIDNKLFDTLVSNISKYNPSDISEKYKDARGKASKEAIMTSLMLKSLYNEYYNQNMFKTKGFKVLYNFLMDRLSDDSFIREAAIRYFGKILAERSYTLSEVDAEGNTKVVTDISDDIMNDFASALGLALKDYMHSDNFFNKFETTIKDNTTGWAIYKLVLPFAAASWNWFKGAINLTPIGLAKSIVQFTRLEKSVAKAELSWNEGKNQINPQLTEYMIRRNLGQGVIGTIGFGLGILLTCLGWIRLKDDDYGVPKLQIGNLTIDISSIFGSNSILAGAAMMDGFVNDKNFMTGLNKAGTVLLDNMPLMELLEMDMYSSGPADIMVDYLQQSLLSFIPNGVAWLAGAMYSGDVKKDTFWKRAVAKIPFLNTALAATGVLDKKVDVYTGSTGSYLNAINRIVPYFSLRIASLNEQKTTALGLNKTMLRGQYTINDKTFKVTGSNLQKLNERYGQWNAEDLTKFYDNKMAVKVKAGNVYKTMTYSQMDSEQRKKAVNTIMSNNAELTKIVAWLSEGHKYYASEETYKKLITKGVKRNIYRGTQGFVE